MERMVGTTDGRVVVDFELVAEVQVWARGCDVTVGGTLTATYLSGSVELNSVSGDIEVEAVSGRLKATSVSGSVTVNAGSVTELSAKSMSGELALDLDIKPAGRYECRTASGDIALRLSPDASVGVEATSLSGRLDDGYTADGRSTRHRLSMQLGQADARLRAQTLS